MRVAQVLLQGIRWCVEATDRLVFLSRKLSYCSFSCFEGEVGSLNCRDFNRVKRCISDIQPCSPVQPRPRCVETSGDVIENAFTSPAGICRARSSIIACYFCWFRINRLWELKRDLHFVTLQIFVEQIRLAPRELTFVPKFMGALLGHVLASRVPVSAFWRYRVSLQRKKRREQIIGLNDQEVQAPLSRKRKSISRTVSDLTGKIQSAGVERQPGVEHLRCKARRPLVPPTTSIWPPEITVLQPVQ